MALDKAQRRHKISKRIRGKVLGTPERPRLAVFRSNTEIYAQLIDDTNRHYLGKLFYSR
jgi:large subunit ribosomal protein L18